MKIFHQDLACHKAVSAYQLIVPQCQYAGEPMDDQLSKRRDKEPKYLVETINCLRYIARQRIVEQGHDGSDNFTQLLRLLGTKDNSTIDHLEGKFSHRYTNNDSQNEPLDLFFFTATN